MDEKAISPIIDSRVGIAASVPSWQGGSKNGLGVARCNSRVNMGSTIRRNYGGGRSFDQKNWLDSVNQPQTKAELEAVRLSLSPGQPFGDESWLSFGAPPNGWVWSSPRTPAAGLEKPRKYIMGLIPWYVVSFYKKSITPFHLFVVGKVGNPFLPRLIRLRRAQFTLRALLAVMLIVAIVLGAGHLLRFFAEFVEAGRCKCGKRFAATGRYIDFFGPESHLLSIYGIGPKCFFEVGQDFVERKWLCVYDISVSNDAIDQLGTYTLILRAPFEHEVYGELIVMQGD